MLFRRRGRGRRVLHRCGARGIQRWLWKASALIVMEVESGSPGTAGVTFSLSLPFFAFRSLARVLATFAEARTGVAGGNAGRASNVISITDAGEGVRMVWGVGVTSRDSAGVGVSSALQSRASATWEGAGEG